RRWPPTPADGHGGCASRRPGRPASGRSPRRLRPPHRRHRLRSTDLVPVRPATQLGSLRPWPPGVAVRNFVIVNANHARVCTSPEWAEHIQTDILPILTRDVDLGADMLEIGPGPGAATDWLRHKVSRLTAVEIDETAAALLADRFAGTAVEIVTGSGTELRYPANSFDSVGCFTMLHHVPTLALQNKILAEA